MSGFRVLGLAILIVGIVLLAFGIKSTHAANEKVVETVAGHYTQTTTWYIVGGIFLIIVGGGMSLRRRP
jgi:LPXTG-motif cell wall-anchored protein